MLNAINVVFVRHGETVDNVKRIVQGHRNSLLSDTGRLQAQLLGENLVDHQFTRVYSSDLSRAFETAEILLKFCRTIPGEIKPDRRLRERSFGEFEGLHVSRIYEESRKLGIPAGQLVPPGAETLEDVEMRVQDFLQTLLELGNSHEEEHVLVVSHGAWLQRLMFYLHGNSTEFTLVNFNKSKGLGISGNTGVTRLRIHPRSLNDDEPHRIVFSSIYDVSHLKRDCDDNTCVKTTTVNDGV